jgi:hypothetical protein
MRFTWSLTFLLLSLLLPQAGASAASSLNYQSPFIRAEFAADRPALAALAVDSLGKNKLGKNLLLPPIAATASFEVQRGANEAKYWQAGTAHTETAAWTFQASPRQMRFASSFSGTRPVPAVVMDFDLQLCHATLLGLMNDDGSVRLPTLLHLPDYGTFRITASSTPGLSLGYELVPYPTPRQAEKFLRVTFPGASRAMPHIDYSLDVVAIHPEISQIDRDPRFDGFRRNFLNMFQLSPRWRALANNTTSDICAITVWEYGDVALRTPPLAPGLTALDILRQTLDRYLGGLKGCGMKGYNAGTPDETAYDFLDAYPSLVIAGADYVLGSHDEVWLRKNYPALQAWATKMLAFDSDGDGLLEYPQTRESGPWPRNHPANWWDTVWFNYKDAYSNALAYRAWLGMAKVAQLAGKPDDARYYSSRAEKLRSVYATTFYNPATGVLAGWKDRQGKLHDYYFTFVTGMAISYGLIQSPQANEIMDHMLAKMRDVGYTRFDLGLPGNLIPIRKEDYGAGGVEGGEPEREDGTDAFQNYENGGATACWVGYTIIALYQIGRQEEGDRILFPLLRAYEEGGFQGRGPNGKTKDWKRWDGTPKGYEGLLADDYLSLLAVESRIAAH